MFFVPDDLAYAICLDEAADGILYTDDIAINRSFDLTVFKREVAALGGAVLQDKILAIAEGLGALDMTTNESQILGIPAEIFSLDDAVVNGNVLGVPEGVLGLEIGISDLDVFDVLEGILAREGKLGKLHILALKKWILGVNGGVLDGNIRASPTELRAIDVALGKRDVFALAKRFYTVERAFFDIYVIVVPKCCAAGLGHRNIRYFRTVYVPKGIAQSEITAIYLYISALLERTFAVCLACEGAIYNFCIFDAIQGAFLVVVLVYVLHSDLQIVIVEFCLIGKIRA